MEWSIKRHASFPPTFKAAAKAFLLCAHRHHQSQTSGAEILWCPYHMCVACGGQLDLRFADGSEIIHSQDFRCGAKTKLPSKHVQQVLSCGHNNLCMMFASMPLQLQQMQLGAFSRAVHPCRWLAMCRALISCWVHGCRGGLGSPATRSFTAHSATSSLPTTSLAEGIVLSRDQHVEVASLICHHS